MSDQVSFDPQRPGGPRRTPPPEGVGDLERLLALEQIRQLVARYAIAMDSRDLDALAELFTDDYEAWSGRRGREALREEFEGALRQGLGGEVAFTQLGAHVINLHDGETASGTLYCTAEFGDGERWIRQAIAYEDSYERRDGIWYLASREHHLFYGLELGEQPLAQEPAEWPANVVGVGTAPYCWESWKRFQTDG